MLYANIDCVNICIELRAGSGRINVSGLIILAAVLLAAAPLLHFLPDKRQRRQARLREAAALAGLFVEFRDLPIPENRRRRLSAAERQVLFYGCRFTASTRVPPPACVWYREGEAWRSRPARVPAPAWLREASAAVLAASVDAESGGFYWREEGGEALVQELAPRLIAWRDELMSQ